LVILHPTGLIDVDGHVDDVDYPHVVPRLFNGASRILQGPVRYQFSPEPLQRNTEVQRLRISSPYSQVVGCQLLAGRVVELDDCIRKGDCESTDRALVEEECVTRSFPVVELLWPDLQQFDDPVARPTVDATPDSYSVTVRMG